MTKQAGLVKWCVPVTMYYNQWFYEGSNGIVHCSLPPVDPREELLYHCQPRSSYPGGSRESEGLSAGALHSIYIQYVSTVRTAAWEMYSVTCRVISVNYDVRNLCTYELTLKRSCCLIWAVEEWASIGLLSCYINKLLAYRRTPRCIWLDELTWLISINETLLSIMIIVLIEIV